MDGFFRLHDDLPREGPGCEADVAWAVSLAGAADANLVLDAGAGPGGDVAALRKAMPAAQVIAVDSHAPFIDRLGARYGNDPKVTGIAGDMMAQSGPFDLIWCAGAIYFVGVTEALRAWRGCLAPGGHVAFSQACLFHPDPPKAVETLFEGYPVTDADGIKAQIDAAGFRVIGSKRVPDAAWEAYYQPQEARIAMLGQSGNIDPGLQAAIAEAEQEIAIWRAHRNDFGYQLFVVETV